MAEQQEAGLISELKPDEGVEAALDRALSQDVEELRRRAHEYVATKGDLNEYILKQIHRVALGGPASAMVLA